MSFKSKLVFVVEFEGDKLEPATHLYNSLMDLICNMEGNSALLDSRMEKYCTEENVKEMMRTLGHTTGSLSYED